MNTSERYPDDARRCDGCGAVCARTMLSLPRAIRADGQTDVASFFEPGPRFVPTSQLSTPGRLTWCCECHRSGSYCLPGDHETRRVGDREPDTSGLITVPPGQHAPRCLAELGGATCDLAERGRAHAHPAAPTRTMR